MRARNITRRLLFSIAVIEFCLFATAASAQQSSPPPLITVTGQAEVRVPPDEVVFTLAVSFVDEDLLAAKKMTDDSVREVFSVAKKSKVSQDDVQTSYISVEPKYNTDDLDYEQRRTVKRQFVGYEVSQTIVVRLHEISRFDDLLSDVLKAGVTRVRNVEFRDSQIRKHKDQARAQAIKAAQEKAILLTREIGQRIGAAYSISESGGGSFATSNISQNSTSVISGDLSERGSESAIAPGLISVTALVTVSFRLQ
jgi:hypothetical protein